MPQELQVERVELSLIAPLYNEEQTLPLLIEALERVAGRIGLSYEIVLVNDGSRDQTAKVLRDICEQNHHIKGIFLSRNYGQQMAMSAGMAHASGERVVIMDGDLQNPPDAIETIVHKLTNEDIDIVYTTSKKRERLVDQITSQLFWFVIQNIFNIKIIPNQLMMKGMSRRFLDSYLLYSEHNRVVAGITQDMGFPAATIEVETQRRVAGRSSYTQVKRLFLALDLIIDLSARPLNAMLYFGALGSIASLLYGALHLYRYAFDNVTPGFTSIILSISFFHSLTIFMLGIIGRYIANIYDEVRARPLYHVAHSINVSPSTLPRRP